MRGANLVLIILFVTSISAFSSAETESQKLLFEEIGDAPGKLWGPGEIGEQWQIVSPNNTTTIGTFTLNDSVDVFALNISSTNWTMVGFWVSNNDSVSISVQRLNQSTWSIVEFANGDEGELGLDHGLHAIRLERIGSFEEEISYRFTLENIGTFDGDERFVNLAWMFTPFYVFAGIFLILPIVIVLWWNRNDLLPPGKKDGELLENERYILNALRERFVTSDGAMRREELNLALSVLGEGSWNSISEELGIPEIRYFTENIDICAWRFEGSRRSFLIGIRTGASSWEMAAIRIFSPLGEVTTIRSVVPEMVFQDDEIFIGNLEAGTTTFVQIETLGNPPLVNMHISGLVDGKPVAAVPTNSIELGEE